MTATNMMIMMTFALEVAESAAVAVARVGNKSGARTIVEEVVEVEPFTRPSTFGQYRVVRTAKARIE